MYAYSAKDNAFYIASDKSVYQAAGTWPSDAIDVDESVFSEFALERSPEGKVRAAGNDGLPAWIDIPPLTKEEAKSQAEAQKNALLYEADSFCRPWQTQLLLGIITDADKVSLTAWMKYYQQVQSVDVTKPEWPEKPE